MDLGAFSQIENLNKVMVNNGINVPRLRGLRLMSNEEALSKEKIAEIANRIALDNCEMACQSDFLFDPICYEISSGTNKIVNKYLVKENYEIKGIRWDRVHGYKRKMFKYIIKTTRKKVEEQYGIFNKYCGRNDVLYIHARIGGNNWACYDGPELAKQPWFLEK